MIIQPHQIRCIQIRQNGSGLSLPYQSFFVTDAISIKSTQNRFGGGDFELVVPYNQRNVNLFSKIETIPTFVTVSFFLDTSWDTQTANSNPHPMPCMAESYNEEHDLDTKIRTIRVSGRGVLDVLLSNKVVIPKLIYESPEGTTEENSGFYPWDIVVDVFGRNINGEKTPTILTPTTVPPDAPSYLIPDGENTDSRFVSNVSLLHNITPIEGDRKIEKTFDGESLTDIIKTHITADNLCITGQMTVDALGCIHFDYMIQRLTDLTLGTARPLVYDYGAMPPKTYNRLLSTQELRQVAYVKPPAEEGDPGSVFTVTKGSQADNAKYKGWNRKEIFVDGSSVTFGDTVDAQYIKMLRYLAADELYAEGNVLIDVENVEFLFTPLRYYTNCWPGCIYTSIGPNGTESKMLIINFVLTGSKQDGWIITPELARYTDPYEE